MDKKEDRLMNILQKAGYSKTKPRQAVFDKLLNGPLAVGELAKSVNRDIDRATVYRTIELFEKLGIVNRSWHNFENKVELSEVFIPHHHNAVCQNCGSTTLITDKELEFALNKIAKENNFIMIGHSIEIIGYCQKCH